MMVFLGSRDELAHLGYVMGRCPKCGAEGPLTVYQSKRRVTVSIVASLPVSEQRVIECRACSTRFALPKEMLAQLEKQMISADRLVEYLGRLPYDPALGPSDQEAPPTLYQTLQVDPYADVEVIEAAYKRLALKYHPDRNKDPDAPEMMRSLTDARAVLTDEGRRRAYNQSIGIKERVEKIKVPEVLRPDDI